MINAEFFKCKRVSAFSGCWWEYCFSFLSSSQQCSNLAEIRFLYPSRNMKYFTFVFILFILLNSNFLLVLTKWKSWNKISAVFGNHIWWYRCKVQWHMEKIHDEIGNWYFTCRSRHISTVPCGPGAIAIFHVSTWWVIPVCWSLHGKSTTENQPSPQVMQENSSLKRRREFISRKKGYMLSPRDDPSSMEKQNCLSPRQVT